MAPERPAGPGPLGGLLPPGFPMLYRSDRALVTAIVGGGFGVYSDSNPWFVTHRVQGNLEVTPRLNLTLEYFYLAAAERNNAGANPALAQLASTDLGQEVTFTTRWAATDRIFFQGIASLALPGEALEAIGADELWVTLQASLYWTF